MQSYEYPGVILSYDPTTCKARVIIGGSTMTFFSTSFYTGLVTRAPRVDDRVRVVLSEPFQLATDEDIQGVWLVR